MTMQRFLLIDVGAGTMDILFFDRRADLHYKAVVRSPAPQLALLAEAGRGPLLITGVEMGGGRMAEVLKSRVQRDEVIISKSAAATLHHDLQRVSGWGLSVVEDGAARELIGDPRYTHLELADLDPARLERIVQGFGVRFEFDAVAVCAQDHGVPPLGVSHLDFRHRMFRAALEREALPHRLLYRAEEVPKTMSRLRAVAVAARRLPTRSAYVMDSGMAAILGASMDPRAQAEKIFMVLDIATSHTVAAVMANGELAGFFEYHTKDLEPGRLERLLKALAEGRLTHEGILAEGGHGAFLRRAVGFSSLGLILATGPKRRLAADVPLPITPGAPLGDNMMTGAVGLLEAVRLREGLAPIYYG
jgi:uncharacterized protein (DUF1786 family)